MGFDNNCTVQGSEMSLGLFQDIMDGYMTLPISG